MVARFRREARAANRVVHPNIIGIYDFGQLPEGRFFLAMEYADGEPVSQLLSRIGRLPVPRVLTMLAQLASAIDHAHALGVIHRDLKPSNLVIVQKRGQKEVLKVVDFGIAKIIAPEYADSVGATQQGLVYGTPAYMAPELTKGQGSDPRIDIYALGCIGFEILVGETPFTGSMVSVMNAHVTRPPPVPSERRGGDVVPPELDQVLSRCLKKDPDQRFQTGREVRFAIEQVPGFGEDRTPSGRRSYHRIPISALPAVPAAGGFEDVRTDAETAERRATAEFGAFDADIGLAPTLSLSLADTRHQYHHALRALVEALIDIGCGDFQLRIGLVSLNERAAEIEKLLDSRQELEHRSATAEQRFREHEASLRFAVGELRFERDQALAHGRSAPVDLDMQITQLESRLAEIAKEFEHEGEAITDRGVAVAAALANKEEELAALHDAIGRLGFELATPVAGDQHIQSLRAHFAVAQQALLVAQAIGPDPDAK
jgi:hypothetical protein